MLAILTTIYDMGAGRYFHMGGGGHRGGSTEGARVGKAHPKIMQDAILTIIIIINN